MIRSYLQSTITYFKNHKSFLFINLIGLTTGLTAFYFAFVYINFELSYDSYHENADNIYRIVVDAKTSKIKTIANLIGTVKVTYTLQLLSVANNIK